jgi:hypothetical protein
MAAFYGNFVENCSQLMELLHTIKQNDPKFIWAEPQQTLFDWLKAALLTPLTPLGDLCYSVTPVRWRFQLFFITRKVTI